MRLGTGIAGPRAHSAIWTQNLAQLELTERFTRIDYDTLRYEVTIDDPGAYTRPWSTTLTLQWVAGDLPFHLCQENRP
jgi:hypothetical protein